MRNFAPGTDILIEHHRQKMHFQWCWQTQSSISKMPVAIANIGDDVKLEFYEDGSFITYSTTEVGENLPRPSPNLNSLSGDDIGAIASTPCSGSASRKLAVGIIG